MFEALAYFAGYKKADIYPRTAATIPVDGGNHKAFASLCDGMVEVLRCFNLWSVPFYTDLGGDW